MIKQNIYAIVLCTIMSVSLLAGCSVRNPFSKEPQSAGELLKQYAKEEHDNFSVDGMVDIKTSVEASGMSVDIPVPVSIEGDLTGDVMHGEIGISTEIMGESVDETMEFYEEKDKDTFTVYQGYDGEWTKSESDLDKSAVMSLVKDIADISWTSFERTDDGYELKTDFEGIKDIINDAMSDVLSGIDSSESEDDEQTFIDSMDGGEFTYVFDKDLNLVSITMEELSGETKTETDDVDTTTSISVSMEMQFDDFGKIKDIEIPDEVKDAEEVENPLEELTDIDSEA